MFRLRSKSGDESVFRTPEEIRSALLSGFVTPDAQIWDAALKGWVPLLEHPLYQQIAAAPPGRKSSSVKSPPSGSTKAMPPVTPPSSSPTTVKPVQKLVIRRPGEGAAPAAPAAPVQPPAPPAKPAQDEMPELEMIDVDLSLDEAPVEAAPPAPVPPPPPPAPPKRPTPPPAPVVQAPPPAPRPSTPRPSTPRVSAPVEARPAMASMESMASESSGSRKGIVIGAVVVLLAAGGAFFGLRGKLGGTSAAPDSTLTPRVAVADSTPDTTTVAPPDTTTPAPAPVDTIPVAAAAPVAAAPVDTTPVGPAIPPVPFAPIVARGAASWNSRPPAAAGLSIPELESVRLRYLAAQARALEQFEAGLQASGFADMFAPAKVSTADNRGEALDAVDAARFALNDFRRKQAALDFAYRDSLRAALPAGSDDPDLRTFGPLLRENAIQLALTDSLIAELAEVYGTLVRENGSYTVRGRDILFKEQPTADRYRDQQEKLTAQLARIRNRPLADVPPAQAAILRGIGLPR
jgi:hypothetical protein